jgi:transposase
MKIQEEQKKKAFIYNRSFKKYGIQSRNTVVVWLPKHSKFDWETQTPSNIPNKNSRTKINGT